MMGIGPEAVLRMPIHDYEAAIYHWNRQSESEDDEPEALDADDFALMLEDVSTREIGRTH